MSRTAVITGASGGIGAAIAKQLARDGMRVVLHYNTGDERALALQSELHANGADAKIFRADLSDPTQSRALIEYALSEYGAIDALINNAGISIGGMLCDMSDRQIRDLLDTNLLSAIVCAREASKAMLFARRGSLIQISSMWGQVGASCESVYAATKAGLIALTKSLAKELGPCGIRVNCVCPGLIDTDMNRHLNASDLQELIDATPCARIGTPQDVADAVSYLLSDRATYIQGQILGVNGGYII